MVMMLAAGTVIGALAMRPKCETPVTSKAVTPATVVARGVAMPPAIQSFAMPATAAPGRNVFAFESAPPPARGQARVPVLHGDGDRQVTTPPPTVVVKPVEASPFNYLGAFGPQDNPILVYKGNGDVVNVPLRKR